MLNARVTWNHGPLVLNEHFDDAGVLNPSLASDTIVVDSVAPQEQFRSVAEAYHLATGGALGRVHKGMAVWRLQGRILVPNDTNQDLRLADRRRAMRGAFDPSLCLRDSPSTLGAYALDFSEHTEDLASWPQGYIPCRVYARPLGVPMLPETLNDRGVQAWTIDLLLADPRTYGRTWHSLVLSGAVPSGLAANVGTSPAPLGLDILMAGAGATNFTISRSGVSFALDLSACTAGQHVNVVMETAGPFGRGRYITVAGVEKFSIKASAGDTWLDVPVGGTTFSVSNATNVTSCTLAWLDTWA